MPLFKPEDVPRSMLSEIGRGSAWAWGDALRPPTPEEERRLRAELDPALWARTVEGTIAERDEIRSQDVYDALYAAGLLASPTPNAEQRGRVTAALARAGFKQVRAKGDAAADDGSGAARVWRRPAKASAATEGGATLA